MKHNESGIPSSNKPTTLVEGDVPGIDFESSWIPFGEDIDPRTALMRTGIADIRGHRREILYLNRRIADFWHYRTTSMHAAKEAKKVMGWYGVVPADVEYAGVRGRSRNHETGVVVP